MHECIIYIYIYIYIVYKVWYLIAMKEKASQNDQNGWSLGLSYTVYTGVTILLPKAGRLKR